MSADGVKISINPDLPRSVSNGEYSISCFSVNDYSVALEYKGPPLDHSIPVALTVDLDSIPTAKPASLSLRLQALLNSSILSLPVVQLLPVAPNSNSCPPPHEELNLGSGGGDHSSLDPFRPSSLDRNHGGSVGCPRTTGGLLVSPTVFGGDPSVPLDGGSNCATPGDGDGSSGASKFSDSQDHPHALSASSDIEYEGEAPIYWQEENESFQHHSSSPETSHSPQVLPTLSSSGGEKVLDDDADDNNNHGDVALLQTGEPFQEEEPINAGDQVVHQTPRFKKRICHRCLKGSRITEKEGCIACDAQYCSHCVLRAMGSMPEGRKCLGCIGCPVAPQKRKVLGKCSRMLQRLLSDCQVRQIMNSELYCDANQLSPDLICVNDRPLNLEELMLLLNSPRPPRNLKPGNYWYDRLSGLWGQEGHKPCQVISPSLNVGGDMKSNASNGNTNMFVNKREITKLELLGLQWAGIPCVGLDSLWLLADGSCQEEGMNATKGNIWSTKRAKLVSNILCLPTPESPNCYREQSNASTDGMGPRALRRILLVGNDRSGASTIFKQARKVYDVPFSNEERENMKFMIQRNLYGYLALLLEGREQFEEEYFTKMRKILPAIQPGPSGAGSRDLEKCIYSIGLRLKTFSSWLVEIMVSGNLDIIVPSTYECQQYVEELWKEQAIQATYNRRNELELPRVACYFLDRAVEIAKVDYEPSDTDILYADGASFSGGLVQMDFSFHGTPQHCFMEPVGEQEASRERYQLVRVTAKGPGENCKWLEMLEDFGIVLFCIALTDYDEYQVDKGVVLNKMLLSKRLFERIVSHPSFRDMNFLLVLTKFDLLEKKIEKVPLTECEWFHDFNPVLSGSSNAIRAFHYIGVKFKRLFKELTGRKLYVCPVSALEPDAVDGALTYAREIIRWEESKVSLACNELSSESTEASFL